MAGDAPLEMFNLDSRNAKIEDGIPGARERGFRQRQKEQFFSKACLQNLKKPLRVV
jgi:hypothetical protein